MAEDLLVLDAIGRFKFLLSGFIFILMNEIK